MWTATSTSTWWLPGVRSFTVTYPPVVEAVRHAVAEGSSYGAPTMAEVDLAELIWIASRWTWCASSAAEPRRRCARFGWREASQVATS